MLCEKCLSSSQDVLRLLLTRAFSELQLKVLELFKKHEYITPMVLLQEGFFSDARARKTALAAQLLSHMERQGLLVRIARGHYKLSDVGAKIFALMSQVMG